MHPGAANERAERTSPETLQFPTTASSSLFRPQFLGGGFLSVLNSKEEHGKPKNIDMGSVSSAMTMLINKTIWIAIVKNLPDFQMMRQRYALSVCTLHCVPKWRISVMWLYAAKCCRLDRVVLKRFRMYDFIANCFYYERNRFRVEIKFTRRA